VRPLLSRSPCPRKQQERRKEDVKGNADKLESNDPADQQASELEGDDELDLPAEKQ
jgi:hypothetical protein